jgi:rhamnose transport system permease protein
MKPIRELFASAADRRDLGLVGVLLALIAAVGAKNGGFLSIANFSDIGIATAPIIVIALGLAVVVIAGEIDVSTGSLFGLLIAVFGVLTSKSQYAMSPTLAAVVVLFLGAAAGLLNGILVGFGKVPSIIVTLGTMTAWRGTTEFLLHGEWITDLPPSVRELGALRPLGVPIAVLGGAAVFAAVALVCAKTPFGIRLRATGSNANAATLAGVSVVATRITAFVFSGIAVAIAALLALPQLAVIDSGLGVGMELVAVTAVVLGGVSIRGGSGRPSGVLLAAILLGMIRTMLVFLKLGPTAVYWERAIFGVLILAAVFLDPARRKDDAASPTIELSPRRTEGFAVARTAILLVAVLAWARFLNPEFTTATVQAELLSQIAEIALLALPMTLIFLTGGIDLSIGSTMALAAVAVGLSIERGLGAAASCAIGISVGATAGVFNGILVVKGRVHPLITTLATMSLYRGLAEGISGGRPFSGFPDQMTSIGERVDFLLPGVVFPAIVAFILLSLLLAATTFGRNVRAVGWNETVGRMSGIAVDRLRVALFLLSGTFAAIAALLFIARRHTAKADVGTGIELEVITAVVLGGTSVAGGRGKTIGTILGVLLLHELRQFVAWQWSRDELILIVLGAVLLLGVLLDRFRLSPKFGVSRSR